MYCQHKKTFNNDNNYNKNNNNKKWEFCNKSTTHVIIDFLQYSNLKEVYWLTVDERLVTISIELRSYLCVGNKGKLRMVI